MVIYTQEYLFGSDGLLSVPINRHYMEQAYIKVYVDDVLQTLTTHYTIEVLEQNDLMITKSNVVFVSSPAKGSTIRIVVDINREILGTWMADTNTWPRIENMLQHLFDVLEGQIDATGYIRQILSSEWKQVTGSGEYVFYENDDIKVYASNIGTFGYRVENKTDSVVRVYNRRYFVVTGAIDEQFVELVAGGFVQENINSISGFCISAYWEIQIDDKRYEVNAFNFQDTHVFMTVFKHALN